ncbi:AMP-binding protein [Dietzia sp. 179-F 9C3 NHS]|uniref:AMP-binding protein n=1 Tax=Dietzia sp. 179-F 9C3 NHS TaxID=3374295 RepID=UPI003879EE49
MPFTSPLPDVEIPAKSVYDFLFGDIAEADLDRLAFVDSRDGSETTYRSLIEQIDLVAGALRHRGIEQGDVVALHCPNVPAFGAVFHGILRSGAIATTVNSLFTGDEIAKQLRDSGAKMLVTVSPLMEAAKAGAARVGLDDAHVVVLDGAEGHPNLLDLFADGAAPPEVDFDPATHLAVLPYSSGTTGNPKGVMLTHRNLVANVCQTRPMIDVRHDDRLLAVLPFFHIYGMTVLLNAALYNRGCLVTMPRFDLQDFLRTVSEFRCTYVFIAPPVAVALAKHPMVDEYDLSSVTTIFSGAAALDAELGNAVAARLGCHVKQGFGMSEMSPVSHAHRPDVAAPLDSVGVTLPNMTCKIVEPGTSDEVAYPAAGEVDDEGGVALSEPGELWCAGPNVMVGYLNNEQATRDSLDDEGYLHTGDIARVDADGNVYIVDRLKELIKYKGYQVPPAELEALLLTNPQIADAAVVGVRDADGEEVPKAFVVRQQGAELDEQGVMDFVAERVAPYKKVRAVQFIDEVPKSAAGKILRKDLRAGA